MHNEGSSYIFIIINVFSGCQMIVIDEKTRVSFVPLLSISSPLSPVPFVVLVIFA